MPGASRAVRAPTDSPRSRTSDAEIRARIGRGGRARGPVTPPTSASSPSPRPSPSTPCARPTTPASATSARTASRRPCRRSPQRPTCTIRWHLDRPPAVEQGAKGGGALRGDSLDRQRRSAAAASTRRRPRPGERPNVLVQVDLALEADQARRPGRRAPGNSSRRRALHSRARGRADAPASFCRKP